GFRGPDPPADFDKQLSLVTIGGSTTQCFFLSDDQTWTARLGQELSHNFSPVWINNAGLDGHSTHGHQVLLEDFIVPLHPKVALFLVGANDVARGTIAEWDAENVKSGLQFSSGKAFVKSLSAYSEVAALVLNMYRSFTAYQAGLLHQQIDLTKQGYLDVSEEEEKKDLAENANPSFLNDYHNRLVNIVNVSRTAGIEPVLITQPLLAGFGTDDVTGLDLARIKAYGPRQTGKMYWNLVEAYNDVVRKLGREMDVQVIDLAREMPKSSRYFYDFIHYTPAGAQAIGEILDRSLCPTLQTKFPQYVTSPCRSPKQN
ncbi:MAG TPA: SGNH/GDSL hydrolase family protein, partial [Pyrinomonadaceae bacterium]|nr:SGNH/GDSL hydrolase family protein [Pyrinomonadaceae bacterium]